MMFKKLPSLYLLFSLLLIGCRERTVVPSPPTIITELPATAVPSTNSSSTLYTPQHYTAQLAFRPDGRLWSASTDGVALWTPGSETPVLYTAADGLPDAVITDLLVAPDGTLWGSSRSGIFHQTDRAWHTYATADGLPDNQVKTLTIDDAGTIWAATTQAIVQFNGRTWAPLAADLPPGEIKSLFSSNGKLWLQTNAGDIGAIDPGNGRLTLLSMDGLPNAAIQLLGVAPDGTPWGYVAYGHVYRWQDDRWHQVGELGGGSLICDIQFGSDGQPWLGTCGGFHAYGNGVLRLVDGRWQFVPTGPIDGTDTRNIMALAFGPDGALATATPAGIYLGRDGQWQTLRHGPARSTVEAVAVAESGDVWMGFGDALMTRFDGQTWSYPSHLSTDWLTTAPDGTLWAGGNCQLSRLSARGWQQIGTCDDLHGPALDIAFTPDGALWAATGFALAKYEAGEWTAVDRLINQVEIAPDGTLWLMGWHGSQDSFYLAHFDGQTWQEYPSNNVAGKLLITPDGQIWLGGETGLLRFGNGRWQTQDQPLPQIRHLLVYDQTLWLIGDYQLAYRRLNYETWTAATYWTGEFPSGVRDAALDADGVLWLGTSNGLLRIRPAATR